MPLLQSHTMTDCPKLAKRRKLEEDHKAEKSPNCNTPDHEEGNFFRRKHGKSPTEVEPNRSSKKVFETYKQARKPIKPKIDQSQQSSSEDLNKNGHLLMNTTLS